MDIGIKISTDPMLSRLVQPYNKNDIQQLREQILNNPGKRIIKVWRNKHLSDEFIYSTCMELGVQIEIKEYGFPDFNSAAVYVCKDQLLRQGLTNEYQKYLIGKEYYFSSIIEESLKFFL